jgi:hypothetical protein
MVLGESAILVCVWSATRAGSQVRDQFLQLDRTAFYFDPNVRPIAVRSYEQIHGVGSGAMLWAAPLQNNLTSQPAMLQDKKREGGKLTNVLADKTRLPFLGKNRKSQTGSFFGTGNQITVNPAFLVQGK